MGERGATIHVMTALQQLQSPLFQPESVPSDEARELVALVEKQVIHPLKSSPDPDTWAARFQEVQPRWLKLRQLAGALVFCPGAELTLEDVVKDAAAAPLTLLVEPAAGAARYALRLLFWISEEILHMVRNQRAPDIEALALLVGEIAAIELCWLTMLQEAPPPSAVAEEAAWEAYSRARALRRQLRFVGLDPRKTPREDPHQAGLRAAHMIDRMAAA